MCAHGNFPSSCRTCKSDSAPTTKLEQAATNILEAMGLNWEDLQGKKVLEIGAGLAELAQAAKKRGIDVASLEKNPAIWEEEGDIPMDIEYIVGDATTLPFADESLDLIISKAAPPTISQTQEEVSRTLAEAMRVLKEGGVFRFGPARMVYLGENPLFTEEEDRTFTQEQRAGRVLEKSLVYLRTLYPEIRRVDLENSVGVFELMKPSQA